MKEHICHIDKKNKGLKVSINQWKRYNLVENTQMIQRENDSLKSKYIKYIINTEKRANFLN